MPSNITGRSGVNVYLNRDPIQGTLPVLATQVSATDPITISLKGITNFAGAGKIIKINSTNDGLEYGDDAGSNWTLNGSNLYPLSTSTNILIGTTTNNNGYGILVLDKNIAIKTSAGSGSSQGLRIINDTYSVLNYLDSSGEMFWAGSQNNYNFDKQIKINTSGSGLELSNGSYTYTLPTSSGGTLALTTDIGTSIFTASSNIIEPIISTNNKIKLTKVLNECLHK